MKCKLLIAIIIMSILSHPWLTVDCRQKAAADKDSSMPFDLNDPDDDAERFQNEVRPETGGLLVTDNPVRRLEFTTAGLSFIPKEESRLRAEAGFQARLTAVASGRMLYLPNADRQTIEPVSEGNKVYYSRPFDIIERYRAADSSVEMRLSLEQPFGSDGGDLSITFELTTSLQPKRPDQRPRNKITFYYGEQSVLRCGIVKVIDASQRERSAKLRLEGNSLSIIVAGEWLKEAIYPVTVVQSVKSLLSSAAGNDGIDAQAEGERINGSGFDSSISQDSPEMRPSVMSAGPSSSVPGLVLGLRHNVNQQLEGSGFMAFFSASASASVDRMDGGDKRADLHRGYEWWMVRDIFNANPADYKLPPGIVLGLKHSENQSGVPITVFGHDPFFGPFSLPGFQKQAGGDHGAPSGQGFYWYESTGAGFSDWSEVNNLPRYTVLGLKHSINQSNKKFSWQGKTYDPADPSIAPPPGFERKVGGDLGAPEGHGFCWYEKMLGSGPVVKPSLSIKLRRSLILSIPDNPSLDLDRDSLLDDLEDEIANAFRPYCIFDSNETAREFGRTPSEPIEPVTLFQVGPVIRSRFFKLYILQIKWVFLFRQDGGYGPTSSCFFSDAHPGDTDTALYSLVSDNGIDWRLFRAGVGDKNHEWPTNSRLEVYDITHPIIYMSASKHHEYFTRDWDLKGSIYSKVGCGENVNGLGARVLIDLKSISPSLYNNVGESTFHPASRFINDLGRYYSGHSAWGSNNFYSTDAGPISKKWLNSKPIR